jgi:hypothetical protein
VWSECAIAAGRTGEWELMKFWIEEPLVVKLFLFVLLVIVVLAVVRLGRTASRLYVSSRRVSAEEIFRRGITADDLANYALSNRAFSKAQLSDHLSAVQGMRTEGDARALRAGEIRFTYLCEKSLAEISSVKTATQLLFLLCWIMVSFGAIPTYHWMCNDSNLPSQICQMQALDQILKTLCTGLGLCALLHVLSGRVERKLRERRAEWVYFFAAKRADASGTE